MAGLEGRVTGVNLGDLVLLKASSLDLPVIELIPERLFRKLTRTNAPTFEIRDLNVTGFVAGLDPATITLIAEYYSEDRSNKRSEIACAIWRESSGRGQRVYNLRFFDSYEVLKKYVPP